jgi:hypothetical protein
LSLECKSVWQAAGLQGFDLLEKFRVASDRSFDLPAFDGG